jgi:hypothetical protein
VQGLTDRSRRRYANQLPFQVENFILNVKREHASWGARKILERLLRRFFGIPIPAKSTIHAVLDRHGLVERRGRVRRRAQGTTLSVGQRPNEQRGPSNDITYLVFSVPTSETLNNRINLISIGVQSTEAWEKQVSECGCGANSALSLQDFIGATAIGRTSSTVFSVESRAHEDALRTKYQSTKS